MVDFPDSSHFHYCLLDSHLHSPLLWPSAKLCQTNRASQSCNKLSVFSIRDKIPNHVAIPSENSVSTTLYIEDAHTFLRRRRRPADAIYLIVVFGTNVRLNGRAPSADSNPVCGAPKIMPNSSISNFSLRGPSSYSFVSIHKSLFLSLIF